MRKPKAVRACAEQASMRFLTMADVAERMCVVVRTVRRWIRDKKLRSHKAGRIRRISEADFADFLVRHRDD
jgi:excisionase family DNA binding protein